MKRLSWLSVEDYWTTPLEIMVVSAMKGYLRQMPVQSIIEGAKLVAFIDEAVADALRRMEQDKSDVAQIAARSG